MNSRGYCYVPRGKRRVLAHRVAWEEQIGPLPVGVELHHACENKACRNLAHLEPLTKAEHTDRHRTDVCRHGHPRTDENTYVYPDGVKRQCIDCRRAA